MVSSVSQQVKDLLLETNDTTVLQTEKDAREAKLGEIEHEMWKMKIDKLKNQEPDVAKEEVCALCKLKIYVIRD